MTNNNASDNTNYGIYLSGSGGNTLKQNDVLSNGYGLYISGSNGNTLLKNNFIDNINYNAYNTNGINSWSFNYYSDYTGSDSNNDGIGDTAYYIEGDSGARDLSPSMQPVPVLSVILSSPSSSSVSTLKGNPATFIATIDQVANITWILNGVMIQTNTSILTASYYNSSGQLGTHNLTVVADNVNGTDQKKWTWTVTEPPRPLITLSSPSSSSVSTLFGNSATFTATINQVANLTWILDGVTLYTNTSILTASYYNGSGQLGTHNLTVVSQNANGTDQKKWTWSVIVAPGPSITLSSPSSSSVSTLVGNSATFISTVDQIANVTWILDGVTLYTNTSILTASYYNSSGQLGTHNLTVVAVNANGADQKKWTWSVTVPAAPSITLSSPSSSSVSNIKGDSRTFIATVNQVATVTWILDGVTIQTNTSIQTASYHNSSAQPGVHNLTVAAVNANGADQKKWTWTVTDPARYTMQLLKGWNLISIPITPDTPDTTAVFGSNSDVILPIYTWNTASRQYYESNTIEIAKGYWVLALNDTTVIITGTP
jgi:parallel beta-helix repeat protein